MAENESGQRSGGWEREVIERIALAALQEQRRARRWGIFFKLLFAGGVLAFLWLVYANQYGPAALSGRYTALVDLDGEIAADSRASADNIIQSLDAAFEDKNTAGV